MSASVNGGGLMSIGFGIFLFCLAAVCIVLSFL